LPLESQKSLARYFRLPDKPDEQIELALGGDARSRDLILCNGEFVLFKATIGRLPVIDVPESPSPWQNVQNMLARFRGIRLLGFEFDTAGGKKIETAASGCMIVQHHAGSLAARLIANDGSSSDGMISLIVAAPLSMLAYLSFLFRMLIGNFTSRGIPSTIGYIKSSGLDIDSEVPLTVDIDGEPLTRTPVKCEVLPGALRINTGPSLDQAGEAINEAKERVDVRNLPIGNELTKAKKRAVPFFSYASEERFKDLFVALRDDARMSGAYVVLMILSTLLATIGLYQNSTSVVIGAMLLAPLMSPIVSLAMGILRYDQDLSRRSAAKVVAGVVLALASAVFITLLFPYKPVTNEMLARLSPSLLDLGVAIFAGVAGA
jgi:multisubunit Na+/H+ antiporter MnhG subunit